MGLLPQSAQTARAFAGVECGMLYAAQRSVNLRELNLQEIMAKKSAKKSLQLGRPTALPASPAEAVLDRLPNPHPDTNYLARFTMPEFTSMPARSQASRISRILVIDYVRGAGW